MTGASIENSQNRKFAKSLLIATANVGKAREFRDMLGASEYQWTDLTSQSVAPPIVEETGDSFLANAILKAVAYAKFYKLWSLADDSGLAVNALNGSPGIYSARWAERHHAGSGDAANNALLLDQLVNVADDQRNARFVCALVLSDPAGRVIASTQQSVGGQILLAPRGKNGFGYDPLFLIKSLGKTAAELSPDEKHEVSHRGQALRAMRDLMRDLF